MSEITNEFDQPQNENTSNRHPRMKRIYEKQAETDLTQQLMNEMFLELTTVLPNDGYAFKGGYVLMNIAKGSRATVDIDMSISSLDTYEIIITFLTQYAENLVAQGIIGSYVCKKPPTPTMSGGITFYDASLSVITKLDVGYHPTNIGVMINCIHDKQVFTFSPTRMMVDKICATHSKKRFRRIKDLYDISVLINNFTFDTAELLPMLAERSEDQILYSPFKPDILIQWSKAWDKFKLNSPQGTTLTRPTFDSMIQDFQQFMQGVRSAINTDSRLIWNENRWQLY